MEPHRPTGENLLQKRQNSGGNYAKWGMDGSGGCSPSRSKGTVGTQDPGAFTNRATAGKTDDKEGVPWTLGLRPD